MRHLRAWWALLVFAWRLLRDPDTAAKFLAGACVGHADFEAHTETLVAQAIKLYEKRRFAEAPLHVTFMDEHERTIKGTEWIPPYKRFNLLERHGHRYAAARETETGWIYREVR